MSFLDPQNPGIGGLDELTDAEELIVQSITALGDPSADRILFWDNSSGGYQYLIIGSGLTITDTTISASADLSGYVPYTGATSNLDLGVHTLTCGGATINGNIVATTTLGAATGDEVAYTLNYTTNKATSGDDYGLVINYTDTSSPGQSYPFEINVGGTSIFQVRNSGTAAAVVTIGGTGAYLNVGRITMGTNGSVSIADSNWSSAGDNLSVGGGTYSSTSGQTNILKIEPVYNQTSGTASNTDLLINRTETAVGSGSQYLIDAQVGSVSKFSVDNTGTIKTATKLGILEGGATPSKYTYFQGGDQSIDLTYTLPTAYPAVSGYVLACTDAGVMSWVANGGGATTALDNLASVAINTTLVSDTDVTDDLGTQAIRWNNIYAATLSTGDTATDTLKLRGYDTNGATYVDVLTITANDTVTADLWASTTIGGNAIIYSGGALGTPSSGTLTNCTGLPAASVVAGTLGTGAYTMDTSLTVPQVFNTDHAIAASSSAATVTRAYRNNVVTNDAAATLTITMSTTGATAGDMVLVQILDNTAVAQTITWVNTEDSTVAAPTTSNGSTTLPLTVGFKWNALTSKWRCIASA